MSSINVRRWSPSPTSKSGSGFYPVTKFVGTVYGDDGRFLAETGKCATRASALKAAEALASKVSA